MKYLESVSINPRADNSGIEMIIRLNEGWKEKASQIPKEVVERIFLSKQGLSNLFNVSAFPKFNDYGMFTGIDLSPDRAGLDLQSNGTYLSHNIDHSRQALIVGALIFEYILALEIYNS